jgi:4-phospho-D-threonate 3-dehydrogenase / 4-phospho-D-erythronate 3-dehydrogenase
MNSSAQRQAPKLLVLGDDLSGTADSAVACVRCAMRARVVLDAHGAANPASASPCAASEDVDVLAVDTDSRRSIASEAMAVTAQAWQAFGTGRRLFKKIDSTLRGNIAAEISALTDRAGMAIVAPAFPHAGRTTRNARQMVFGVPVEESELWRNEGMVGKGDLHAMLSVAGLRVATVGLSDIRNGPAELAATLASHRTCGMQAVVCDAETDGDLRCIAQASVALDRVFWVGSAGLAAPLFEALCEAGAGTVLSTPSIETQRSSAALRSGQHRSPRGVLAVVGSMSSVSHRQVAMLQANAAGSIERIDIDATALTEPGHPAAIALADRVEQAWAARRDVVVALGQDQRLDAADGARLVNHLAAHLVPAAVHAEALLVTGGETARALLSAMGVRSLGVVDELESGVALLVVHEGECRGLPVVTKAGGFGAPDTLYRAWRRLVAFREERALASPSFTEEETMTYRPVIGITMGDAAGVGPEIIMKSLAHRSVYDGCRPLVIGDAKRLVDAGQRAGVELRVRAIAEPSDARFAFGEVDCIDLGLIPPDLPYGKLSAIAGDAAYRYIARTVALTSSGALDAICTAPLNKEALHAGGHLFPGHTEMLAHLTGIPEVSMMLVAPRLRVIHVTTHIGLLDAIARIEPGLVQRTIERAHDTLVRAGIGEPRIGVCGINPHAGENGLFGYGEEEEKIMPAIEMLRERGWHVEGPLPADTLFFRAGRGDFDVVVAMYHDQGHGPVKVMGLEAGVNVTVGLPVIRTSVDHGTAFDIAGKGIADERSMLEALKQAQDLATRRAVQAA